MSEDVRMQGAPVFTLDDLTNDQLRDLILQAFGQLSINEEIPLVDLIEECYNEVKQEVEGTAGKT